MIDYSPLDPLSGSIFYPRPDPSRAPPGAEDLDVLVAPGIALGARLHPGEPGSPHILLFHGNGEVVGDYDELAADYRKAGAGLLVVDFRGYGRSGGRPRISSMIADARACLGTLEAALGERDRVGPLLVMGRSLGTYCALELAACRAERLSGLIIESGSGEIARLLRFAGLDPPAPEVAALLDQHEAKLRGIELPLLAIHGECDELIPLEDARALVARLGSRRKHLEVIPGAGHNDLWWKGRERYFAALEAFIRDVAGEAERARAQH